MANKDVFLRWDDVNNIEKGHRIYRSDTPMDVGALPTPIATVGVNETEYIDIDRTIGNTYYYRVGAFIDGDEMVSAETSITVEKTLYIVSGSRDNTVKMIDGNGNEIWTFNGHTNQVNDVAVDSFGQVYTASADGTLKKLDVYGNEIWTFNGFGGPVQSVFVDSDDFIYSGSSDRTYMKIDPDGTEIWSASIVGTHIPLNIASSGDGGTIVVTDDPTSATDSVVMKIDANGDTVWQYNGFDNYVSGVDVDSSGNIYAASITTLIKLSPDGNTVIWSATLNGNAEEVTIDGNDLFVAEGFGGNDVTKFDLDGNEIWVFTGHTDRVYDVKVDNDGFIYSSSLDGTIKKLDSTGTEVWTFSGHSDSVNAISLSL